MTNIVAMDKIAHMDELKPQNFIAFVAAFMDPNHPLEISEKVDGQNISFGIDDADIFFTKTKKSKPVYDIDFYGDIPFMQGIKRFHTAISERMDVYKLHKENAKAFNVQVFGELLPTAQTNTLQYADAFVGRHGALIIFDVKYDGVSTTDDLDVLSMAFGLKGSGGWQVYPKNIIEADTFEVRHFKLLERLYKKYSDVLVSRKKVDKELKLKAKAAVQSVMNNIKSQFIKELLSEQISAFGTIPPEGLIVRDFKNNLIVKIVDKDGFTNENSSQHSISQRIKNLNRILRKNIKEQIFGNADILKNISKIIEKANDNFFVKSQIDATYTYKSIDDILQVILDDMFDEGRLFSSGQQDAMESLCAEYRRELDIINAEWLKMDTSDLGDSVILVTDSALSNGFDLVYKIRNKIPAVHVAIFHLNMLPFALGEPTMRKLKDEFNV